MKTLIAALAAAASLTDPGPPTVPPTPGAWIIGVGHYTYDEPGVEGHRIRFGITAGVDRDGTAHGLFTYRHLLPDGQLLSRGWAEVTCVHVQGDTALVAAVVPEGVGNLTNHGFYVKIVDGRAGAPDGIETLQAAGGPTRPPRDCVDPAWAEEHRYEVAPGGFTFGT